EIDRASLDNVLLHRAARDLDGLYGAREPLLEDRHHLRVGGRFGDAENAADALARAGAVGEEPPAEGIAVVLDVLEQQRRAAAARHLARDRADLLIPVDLDRDAFEVVAIFEVRDPGAQIPGAPIDLRQRGRLAGGGEAFAFHRLLTFINRAASARA